MQFQFQVIHIATPPLVPSNLLKYTSNYIHPHSLRHEAAIRKRYAVIIYFRVSNGLSAIWPIPLNVVIIN